MAFCTKCGKSNSDKARFCTSCGSTLATGIPEIQKAAIKLDVKPSTNKKYWPLFIIIAALLLGTGAYLIFFNKKKGGDTAQTIPAVITAMPVTTNNDQHSAGQKNNNTTSTAISYTNEYGKLIYLSDCYIIVTGSFVEEYNARDYVNSMKYQGFSNVGYLWIPDYPSLSGKRFYATFIGPYQSYNECETNLRTLKINSRFWYGKKVSNNPEQIEIRVK